MEFDSAPPAEGSSDRSFGLVFAAFFAIIAALPLWHGEPPRSWALLVALLFAVVAAAAPRRLAPLNRAWTKLGLLLGRITGPVALAILFYGVVAPTGVVMRLFGKDPLRLRFDPRAATYWVNRAPAGPEPESLRNQF